MSAPALRLAVAPFDDVERLKPTLERLAGLGLSPGDLTVLTRRPHNLGSEGTGLIGDYLFELDGPRWPEPGQANKRPTAGSSLLQGREALLRSMLQGPARLTEEWNEKWQEVNYILLVTISQSDSERGIHRILLDHAIDRVELHELPKRWTR